MNTEIKTLDGWTKFADRTGRGSIYDYLNKGDIVSEDIVDNFMDMLPPMAMSYDYLQVGEPFSHVYDIDNRLRPTYEVNSNMSSTPQSMTRQILSILSREI